MAHCNCRKRRNVDRKEERERVDAEREDRKRAGYLAPASRKADGMDTK
jgi:hypothetical protein